MAIKQTFETVIFDDHSNLEARIVVVPKSAFRDIPKSQRAFHELGHVLGFDRLRETKLDHLVHDIAGCLALSDGIVKPSNVDQHYFRFAQFLVLGPLVPFQESPLSLDALGTIITRASNVGLGAYAGFVVSGPSPLIFVAVPAGIILVGAASGLAKALEEGLKERLTPLIKGSKRRASREKKRNT